MNTADLKIINLWKIPVEVANLLDLIPLVPHDHIEQITPTFLSVSSMLRMPLLPPPPNPGPHVTHHEADQERSPHHTQVVDSQSHYYYNYFTIFIYHTNATKIPVKNSNKRRYPAKITCELQLCATAKTTTSLTA